MRQVQIGFPKGIDRTDVPPIGRRILRVAYAAFGEAMRLGFALGNNGRDQVIAEIMRGIGIRCIADQQVAQKRPLENIDAHRCQRHFRIAGNGRGISGLFEEGGNPIIAVHRHDAERCRFGARNCQTADRHVCIGGHMGLQHDLVIHFVDVIPSEDQHVIHVVAVHDIYVLGDGIGSAEIPFVFGHALRRGQNIQIFIAFRPKEIPTPLTVTDQGVGLVLRCNRHFANAGIQRIGQRKINDPRLATEWDRRFGPKIRELLQTRAAPPRQNECHRSVGQSFRRSRQCRLLPA